VAGAIPLDGAAASGLHVLEPIRVVAEVQLRSTGAPYELSPTALFRILCLSSGAMTNRLDRLESRGLVRRRPDPEDRRAIVVGLTPAGRKLVDATVGDMLAEVAKLLAGLTDDEQTTLANLLRKLLVSLGSETIGQKEPPGPIVSARR